MAGWARAEKLASLSHARPLLKVSQHMSLLLLPVSPHVVEPWLAFYVERLGLSAPGPAASTPANQTPHGMLRIWPDFLYSRDIERMENMLQLRTKVEERINLLGGCMGVLFLDEGVWELDIYIVGDHIG